MATFDASKRVPMGSSPFFTLPSSGARPMLPTSMGSSTSFSTGSSLPPGGYGMTASGYGSQTNTQPQPSSLVGLGGLQPLVPTSTQANNSQPRPGMPSAAAAAPVTASGASGYYQSTASAAPAVAETAVESAGASAAAASSDDTQVMTKLQQLMNQMGTFMKSVDARLTTLEKMTGQLMNNYTEQSKTMDLRFQEITTLIQQKSSVIQLPHPAAPPAAAPFATPTPPVPPTPTLPPSQSLMSDAEVARQLQEQFDREAHLAAAAGGAGGPHGAYPALGLPPSQPNLTALQRQQMQMHRPQLPAPTPQPPASAAGKEPCPLCGAAVPPADLEAHVNQHFDEAEGIVADTLDKKNAKKQPGFWDRLFGNEDADAPPPTAQPTTPAGAAQVPARPTYPMYPPAPGAYPATQAMYPYFPGQPHQPAFGFPAR